MMADATFNPDDPNEQVLTFGTYEEGEREETRAWEARRRTDYYADPVDGVYRLTVRQAPARTGKEGEGWTLPDKLVLALYREWSEESYAAIFLVSSPETVARFRGWLARHHYVPRFYLRRFADEDGQMRPLTIEPYEREMLEEYRRQEQEAAMDRTVQEGKD